MSEHTPGPWQVEGPSGNEGEAEVVVSDTRAICWTADTWSDEDDESHVTAEDRSNARLIAAAPCLLATIKRMREVFEQLSDGDWRTLDASYVDELIESDGLRSCDLAIAKAKGVE